ncbi:uncharacterized protein P884DRAFT_322721 [Thermothelomyces heterothallicus CBS 202.75]|uniref:uncharacterized protein n=1 Tax=Thermothelomyces heterothallicus CBS 202.75 TaxID=1149848 RepID=UPI0037429683
MDKKPKNGAGTGAPLSVVTPIGNADHSLPRASDNLSGSQSSAQGSPAHEHESTAILPGAKEPRKDKGEREPQSLDELSKDPLRTHRDWYPKYGRVQKCDWCNARSEGTLHVCATCSIRMCEKCARDRRWDKNYSHFIDADALDWKPKAGPKAPRAPKAPKAPKKGSSKRPARSKEPSDPPLRRRKIEKTVGGSGADGDNLSSKDGDNSANLGFHSSRHFPAPTAPTAPTTSHHDFAAPLQPPAPSDYYGHDPGAPPPYHQTSIYGGYPPLPRMNPAAFPTYHGLPAPAMTNTPAAEPPVRSNGRMAATRAKSNIREQSRHLSSSRLDGGEAAEDGDDEYAQTQHHQDDEDPSVELGEAENVDRASRRRDDRERVDNTRIRSIVPGTGTDRDDAQSALAGAPPGPLPPWADYREHDLLVVDIYSSIYGDRPSLDFYRVRTQIPNHWTGGWQASASQYHGGPRPYNYNAYYPAHNHPAGHAYEHHANDVHAATDRARHQHMYPHHSSYQHYSEYQQYQSPYPPGPNPNPYEMAAAHDLERVQQVDQATLDEMRGAWARNPVLNRLVSDNHRVYALGLLWDVFELRRSRVPVRDDSQTVRWFVHERHAQFRFQHAELARRQAHAGAVPPRRTAPANPAPIAPLPDGADSDHGDNLHDNGDDTDRE